MKSLVDLVSFMKSIDLYSVQGMGWCIQDCINKSTHVYL